MTTGQSVHAGYSARGEVTTVRDPALAALAGTAGDWQLGYDPLGRPVREREPLGVERRTAYTEAGFVASVELHSAAALVETYSAHDALGNPGQIDRNGLPALVQYDPRSRIEKVAYPGGGTTPRLVVDSRVNRLFRGSCGARDLRRVNGLEDHNADSAFQPSLRV